MLTLAGLWILPTQAFAATLPLGPTIEIEMSLEAVVATEDLNICNAQSGNKTNYIVLLLNNN